MKPDRFMDLVRCRIIHCEYVLQMKGNEYGRNDDRLRSFKETAKLLDETPEEACLGLAAKHFQCIRDMVRDLDEGVQPDQSTLKEKFSDFHNYLLILEALFTERLDESQETK